MSDELPFDGSAVDTERLGQAIHRVLTRLIAQARGTHAGDWQRPERIPTSVIDDELPDLAASTRTGILEFVTETILPQVHTTSCWDRLRRAETIYVEKPLRAHRRCAGLTFELDGVADVVLAEADGSWHIIELKITFAPLTAATRDRYRTQVAMYGHLLERYVDGEVTTAVEALGVDRDSLHPEATSEAISEILSRFL